MGTIVSAIITTCNRPSTYVIRALKSVLAQNYPYIQIIVVDDSPIDYPEKASVYQAVKEICPDALFINHNYNLGASTARNSGIREAVGEYIAFLDDDDEWLPEKIQRQICGFKNTDIALVYGDDFIVEDSENIQYISPKKHYSGKVYEQLLETNFIGSTSNPLIKRKCL